MIGGPASGVQKVDGEAFARILRAVENPPKPSQELRDLIARGRALSRGQLSCHIRDGKESRVTDLPGDHGFDSERESVYREAYVHGAAAAIRAVGATGARAAALNAWLRELDEWRRRDVHHQVPAPSAPTLG